MGDNRTTAATAASGAMSRAELRGPRAVRVLAANARQVIHNGLQGELIPGREAIEQPELR